MRTYGRVALNVLTPKVLTWVVVETDSNGFNDSVYLTTLIQNLLLNLGESPFWGDWGIPAKPSVVQQVYPDYNVALTQQRFAGRFASLIIAKDASGVDGQGRPAPTYNVAVVTNYGSKMTFTIPAQGYSL